MGKLRETRIAPYGVNTDLSPVLSGPAQWSRATGAVFRRSRTEKADSLIERGLVPTTIPERLYHRPYGGQDLWYYAGAGGVGADYGGASYDLTPVGWPAVNVGTLNWTSLNTLPVLSGRDITPQWHGGEVANPTVDLPGWPADWECEVIRGYSFYLLAIQAGDSQNLGRNRVRWSASADVGSVPSEWVPTPSNDAGELLFGDQPGFLVDGASLRDEFILYKNSSTYSMRVVGGPWVMRQRKLFSTLGMLGLNCCAEWQGHHFLVSENDIVVHDGVNVDAIGNKAIRREIYDNLSPIYGATRSFVVHDEENKQMVFYYPNTISEGWCNRWAAWNYHDRVWSLGQVDDNPVSHAAQGGYVRTAVGNTWEEPASVTWRDDHGRWSDGELKAGTTQIMLAWPNTQRLAERAITGAPNQKAVATSLTLQGQDLGEPERYKMIDRIWVEGASEGPVDWKVQVGSSESSQGPVTWGREQTINMDGGGPIQIGALTQGRYMALKMECVTAAEWYVDSLLVEHRTMGRF